jgi:hypothetical protein
MKLSENCPGDETRKMAIFTCVCGNVLSEIPERCAQKATGIFEDFDEAMQAGPTKKDLPALLRL